MFTSGYLLNIFQFYVRILKLIDGCTDLHEIITFDYLHGGKLGDKINLYYSFMIFDFWCYFDVILSIGAPRG